MSSKARRMPETARAQAFQWTPVSATAPLGVDHVPAAHVSAHPSAAMVRRGTAGLDPETRAAHLDAVEQEAYTKGYERGEGAGTQAAVQQGEAMLAQLAQTLEALTTLRGEMIRATERQMVELSLAVARRIVHREVSLDADLLIAMARVALDRLTDSPQVTIRLHPTDYHSAGAVRFASLGSVVTVRPDPVVARGGCLVESEFGTLDAGVDAQLQELARALLGDDAVVRERDAA